MKGAIKTKVILFRVLLIAEENSQPNQSNATTLPFLYIQAKTYTSVTEPRRNIVLAKHYTFTLEILRFILKQ